MPTYPHLTVHNGVKLLMVHEKPFLMLAGESHNSSPSSIEYMEQVWDKADRLKLNTLFLPITWELLEPEEDHFDFTLVDSLIRHARQRDKKLVLLWFGAWKNGQCQYAPSWVKTNPDRFKRAFSKKGSPDFSSMPFATLSYLCEELRNADAKAFRRLMQHIRMLDEKENTVIMVQVENETGLLYASREYSEAAECLFHAPVPEDFIAYLRSNADTISPAIRSAVKSGSPKGSWEEVFGAAADEIFSAYHVAAYVDYVAAAGKSEYPLPTLCNCWLDNGGIPGDYPSGGPIAKVMAVWQYQAPHIDVIAPDIYLRSFCDTCDEYVRNGNPLLIPETVTHSYAGPRLVYAIGHYHGLGYSPFGFEDIGHPFTPEQITLYEIDGTDTAMATPQDPLEYAWYNETLASMTEMLTDKYGTCDLQAVSLENPEKNDMNFGSFSFRIAPANASSGKNGVCLILREEDDIFYMIVKGCSFTVLSNITDTSYVDILSLEEGRFENNRWQRVRRLNGDEISHLSYAQPTLLRLQLFAHI